MGADGRRRGARALGVAVVGAAAGRARAGGLGRVRAVGAGDGRDPAARARAGATRWRAGCPRWVAEAIAVPLGRPAGLHAGGRRPSPDRSAWSRCAANLAGRAGRRPGHRARAGAVAWSAWCCRRVGVVCSARWPAWCVAWIVAVARRGAALPTAAVEWGTGAARARRAHRRWSCVAAGRAAPRCGHRSPASAAACCCVLVVAGPAAHAGVAAGRVGAGGRATSGRATRWSSTPAPGAGGGRRRRTGPGRCRPLPRPARGRPGPAGGAHPLPRRPRRRAARRASTAGRSARSRRPAARPARAACGGRVGSPRSPGLTPTAAPYGETRQVGEVTLQVLWPPPGAPTRSGDGSTANEASVVLLAEVAGVRILLTGDVEPEGQAALAPALPGLRSTCSRCRTTAAATRTETSSPRSAPGRAGLGRRRQRLRPPGRRGARAAGGGRRAGRCAPTSTATWRWCVDGGEPGDGDALSAWSRVGALWQACRTMAGPSQPRAADVLGRVTLVTGKEEFLNERTVVGRPRRRSAPYDPESEFSETGRLPTSRWRRSASWPRRRCSPASAAWSCAASRTCPRSRVDGLLDYAAAPADDVALVLVHGGGPEGQRHCSPSCASSPTVTESKSGELKASEYPGFVAAEVRGHGATIDPDAAAFLVQAVGPGPALARRRPPTS